MDLSGSMYYFNGYDRRLDKMLATTVMIMESLQGFEHKFEYSIRGHSGDSPKIPLIHFGQPPKNDKERYQILQRMIAHSQYCMSGDNTIESAQYAMKELEKNMKEDVDENFIFLLSDANLQRYGISPKHLGRVLTTNKKIHGYAIFIASLQDEAQKIKKELPPGHGYVCLDTSSLPHTFNTRGTSSVRRNI